MCLPLGQLLQDVHKVDDGEEVAPRVVGDELTSSSSPSLGDTGRAPGGLAESIASSGRCSPGGGGLTRSLQNLKKLWLERQCTVDEGIPWDSLVVCPIVLGLDRRRNFLKTKHLEDEEEAVRVDEKL